MKNLNSAFLIVGLLLSIFIAPSAFSADTPKPLLWAGAPPADQPPGPGMVRGTGYVVDEKGMPVEGAEVVLCTTDWEPREHLVVEASAQTGKGGTFAFEVAYRAKDIRIFARKAGLAVGRVETPYESANSEVSTYGSAPIVVLIRLGPPKELSGVVIDAAGKPAPGVIVSAELRPYLPGEDLFRFQGRKCPSPPGWLIATTDARGVFHIKDLPGNGDMRLLVTAPGQLPCDPGVFRNAKAIWYKPGQTDVRLQLASPARIEGRVVDENTGKPLSNLEVEVTYASYVGIVNNRGNHIHATTNAEGVFAFDGLVEGTYWISQVPTSEWVSRPVKAVARGSGTTTKVELRAGKGVLVKIVARNRVTKNPIPNAWIAFAPHYAPSEHWEDHPRPAHSPHEATVPRVTPDGSYSVRLIPGDYRIAAFADDYIQRDFSQVSPLRVPSGRSVTIIVEENPLPVFWGTVRDEAGKPVPHAYVNAGYGFTKEDGKFRVAIQPTVTTSGVVPVTLSAKCPERNLVGFTKCSAQGGQFDVVLKPKPAVTMSGRIVNDKGESLPWASVSFLGFGGIYTGLDGRFTAGPMLYLGSEPDVNYYVTVRVPGHFVATNLKVVPEVREEGRWTIQDIVLEPYADHGEVTGSVVHAAKGSGHGYLIRVLADTLDGKGTAQARRYWSDDPEITQVFKALQPGDKVTLTWTCGKKDWETGPDPEQLDRSRTATECDLIQRAPRP